MNAQKSSKHPYRRIVAYVAATWFGSGLSPKAPGTAGSLAALPFILLIAPYGWWALLLFALFAFILGIPATVLVQKDTGLGDPQLVVIDEVVGQTIAFLFLPSSLFVEYTAETAVFTVLAFLSFRFFDVWKPWPASYFDSQHSAAGVMLDDVAAGLYAMLFVWGSYFLIAG